MFFHHFFKTLIHFLLNFLLSSLQISNPNSNQTIFFTFSFYFQNRENKTCFRKSTKRLSSHSSSWTRSVSLRLHGTSNTKSPHTDFAFKNSLLHVVHLAVLGIDRINFWRRCRGGNSTFF